MKFLTLILTIFFSTITFAADQIPTNLLTGWNTITESSIKSNLSYLASDNLQGRLALTSGDDKAIQKIVDEFKKAGLAPANNGHYLQAVRVIEYIPNTKKSYVMLERKGKEINRWRKPEVLSDYFHNINVKADVVFAGYGITAPALHYDDYQNIDVTGKIVLIFEHEPQETDATSIFNGTGNTPYATTHVKVLNAQQHGAIAVLIAPEPNRKHPSNQQRRASIGGSNKRVSVVPDMVLEKDDIHIPYAVLSDEVAKTIAGDLSLAELQTKIDLNLQPQSQIIPDTKVTIHDVNSSIRAGRTYNVVGLLEGSDPILKYETIIISAHHDHDGFDGKQIWHGADDNASGTTGVISVAKAMAENTRAESGLKPKRSILFVVFAAEERGLLGAYYMAANPLRPLNMTRAMINFDMIGRDETESPQTKDLIDIPADTTNRLNLIGSHYSPDYDKIVKEQNALVGLDIDDRFNTENALNTFFRSDQFPFVLKGIPAFWWFTGFHPDYHHTTDTADKINYVKMQKILRLAYLSAYDFANTSTAPKFISNPN